MWEWMGDKWGGGKNKIRNRTEKRGQREEVIETGKKTDRLVVARV